MAKRHKPDQDAFLAHLEWASRVVSRWPKWKQELLGGRATTPKRRKVQRGKAT